MALQKQFFRYCGLIAVWMSILSMGYATANDIVVIVNKGVSVESMEKEALRDLFLGNISVWPDDKKINFAILGSSETHQSFVQTYTRKTESQFQAWWKRKLFTGTGKFPPKFSTDQEMIDYVAKTEGGLGYVSSGAAIGDGVKILTVTEK